MAEFIAPTDCAAIVLSLAAMAAHADVRYDFSALSSYPLSGESVTGSFSLIVPDHITTNAFIPAASLLSCSAIVTGGSHPGPATCLYQQMRALSYDGYDTVGFNISTPANPNRAVLYSSPTVPSPPMAPIRPSSSEPTSSAPWSSARWVPCPNRRPC